MQTEKTIENRINELNLNAPRLTPEHIDAAIADTSYYVFPDSMLTVCCLTLTNGFNVVGTSACVSPENFNKEIGQTISFKSAREKIWKLEGYLLKDRLFKAV